LKRAFIPQEILAAAHDRSAARAAGDWATADQLREQIEMAGWRIVDAGTDFRLEPAHAPDVVARDRVRYGRSEAVPSRFEEPAQGVATVVIVAGAGSPSDDIARAVAALRATAPAETSVVIVADGADDETASELETLIGLDGGSGDSDGSDPREIELIVTSAPLGRAAAWNIGIRRAAGPVLVLLDATVEPTGDIVTPLVATLADDTVGVAGPFGLASGDLRRFQEVDAGDAAAIEGHAIAFRRGDAAERGPIDERFRFQRNLDIWWSLVLRDEGGDHPPRRAKVVPALPLVRHADPATPKMPAAEQTRLAKRNFYRVLDRFGHRHDLAVEGGAEVPRADP
jgi:Glycosyl transferase family 2